MWSFSFIYYYLFRYCLKLRKYCQHLLLGSSVNDSSVVCTFWCRYTAQYIDILYVQQSDLYVYLYIESVMLCCAILFVLSASLSIHSACSWHSDRRRYFDVEEDDDDDSPFRWRRSNSWDLHTISLVVGVTISCPMAVYNKNPNNFGTHMATCIQYLSSRSRRWSFRICFCFGKSNSSICHGIFGWVDLDTVLLWCNHDITKTLLERQTILSHKKWSETRSAASRLLAVLAVSAIPQRHEYGWYV